MTPAGELVTVPEPERVTETWTGLGGGWVLELPPPQPESNKTENKAANPPESVQKTRMGSPISQNLSLRCGRSRAGWLMVGAYAAVTLVIAII